MKNIKEIEEMLITNKKQAEFYDSINLVEDIEEQTGYAKHGGANLPTRIWAKLRYLHQQVFEKSGVEHKKTSFYSHWMAKNKGGNFLEIGCFRGTRSSWPLIEAAGSYTGIDLSKGAVDILNQKINDAGLQSKAMAFATDFLVFKEDDKFDLIFAHGVLHHFENSEILFKKISNLLKDDGILILTEPSMVNKFFNIIRAAYRPFQSDSEWEWPFTKLTVSNLHKYLKPLDGFGWGRWSMPFSLLIGLPIVGTLLAKLYIRVLAKELEAGLDKNVWLNSTVVAVYKRR